MAGALGRFTFKLVTALVTIPVSRLITKGTQKAWKAARPGDPIHDPKRVDTRWHDALVWAALTGLGTAVGSLVSAKGADAVWRAATGRPSPRPKPPKQKKTKRDEAQPV
jgi:hypothetical protein